MGIHIGFVHRNDPLGRRVPDPIQIQAPEHGAVVHVVAVDHVIAVAHVGLVRRGQVDGAGQGTLPVDVMIGVVVVVLPLHDGVVDMGVIHREPGPIVLIDPGQHVLVGCGRRFIRQDLGLVLQQVPAGLCLLLGVESIVEYVAGVQDQHRGQKPGKQGDQGRAQVGHRGQDRVDQGLPYGRLWLWSMEIVGTSVHVLVSPSLSNIVCRISGGPVTVCCAGRW